MCQIQSARSLDEMQCTTQVISSSYIRMYRTARFFGIHVTNSEEHWLIKKEATTNTYRPAKRCRLLAFKGLWYHDHHIFLWTAVQLRFSLYLIFISWYAYNSTLLNLSQSTVSVEFTNCFLLTLVSLVCRRNKDPMRMTLYVIAAAKLAYIPEGVVVGHNGTVHSSHRVFGSTV